MKNDWLKEMRDRVADYEMDVPDGLWTEIERSESRRQIAKKTSPVVLLKRIAAVAAMVVAAVFMAYYFMSGSNDMMYPGAGQEIASTHSGEAIEIAEAKPNAEEDVTVVEGTSSLVARKPGKINQNTAMAHSDELGPGTLIVEDAEPEDIAPGDVDTVDDSEPPLRMTAGDFKTDGGSRRCIALGKSKTSGFTVDIYSTGGIGTAGNTSVDRIQTGEVSEDRRPGVSAWADSPKLGILLFNQGQEVVSVIKHHQPIRAGLNFTYKINDRFGIGSGLSYSKLTSDIRSGSDAYYFAGKQTLHYLGLPLTVSYDLLHWKRLRLYASAGGLLEKCISGKTTTDYVMDNVKTAGDSDNVGQRPWQISVNASAGVQFDIAPAIGVYAEPGVSYYFDDRSSLETIYRDKPLNFNFNLGLRLTVGR